MCYCHPHKMKGELLNYMEPQICERADGLKGNVCCSNVLCRVVLDLICFTSAYWHITGLCHLRSLTRAGDSLACYGSRSHLTNAVAQPSITLIHFSAAGLLKPSSHELLCNNSGHSSRRQIAACLHFSMFLNLV